MPTPGRGKPAVAEYAAVTPSDPRCKFTKELCNAGVRGLRRRIAIAATTPGRRTTGRERSALSRAEIRRSTLSTTDWQPRDSVRSSKCRQSAVTLHPETTRADTARLEEAPHFVEYSWTCRPRSRPAWFLGNREIRFRIPLGSLALVGRLLSDARPRAGPWRRPCPATKIPHFPLAPGCQPTRSRTDPDGLPPGADFHLNPRVLSRKSRDD